jgi:hypothetical protein
VLERIAGEAGVTIYSQDDPTFPDGLGAADDRSLEISFRLDIDIVPTLIRFENGTETERVIGWNRAEWQAFTGIAGLGGNLKANQPGCGSRTQEPGMLSLLTAKFGETGIKARRIRVPDTADLEEVCYDRGWTDGMPVTPPTGERILEMLEATRRDPQDIVGLIPPNRVEGTVEKIAINAVMAGCTPQYFPVVLAAVETALEPAFNLHGILATTNAVAPVVMVNGPIARKIGMNWQGNVFGQGNRANATIGRALQLVVRNVGGGRPQEIDRAVFGNPGKYSYCFAEDEDDPWDSYAVERGFSREQSTVTLFAGDGGTPIIDHMSRTPEDLVATYTNQLLAVYNRYQVNEVGAFLAVGYEHAQVFHAAGWSKRQLKDALLERLKIPVRDIVPGRSGLAGLSDEEKSDPGNLIAKFHTGHLEIIRAGGRAGKYSTIISGLGSSGLRPVIKEIKA